MDTQKVIKLLKELLNELAPGTVSDDPQPGELTIGTKGNIKKLLEDIKAQEAQNPLEPKRVTKEDILKDIERRIQEEKYKKDPKDHGPKWTMGVGAWSIYNKV